MRENEDCGVERSDIRNEAQIDGGKTGKNKAFCLMLEGRKLKLMTLFWMDKKMGQGKRAGGLHLYPLRLITSRPSR